MDSINHIDRQLYRQRYISSPPRTAADDPSFKETSCISDIVLNQSFTNNVANTSCNDTTITSPHSLTRNTSTTSALFQYDLQPCNHNRQQTTTRHKTLMDFYPSLKETSNILYESVSLMDENVPSVAMPKQDSAHPNHPLGHTRQKDVQRFTSKRKHGERYSNQLTCQNTRYQNESDTCNVDISHIKYANTPSSTQETFAQESLKLLSINPKKVHSSKPSMTKKLRSRSAKIGRKQHELHMNSGASKMNKKGSRPAASAQPRRSVNRTDMFQDRPPTRHNNFMGHTKSDLDLICRSFEGTTSERGKQVWSSLLHHLDKEIRNDTLSTTKKGVSDIWSEETDNVQSARSFSSTSSKRPQAPSAGKRKIISNSSALTTTSCIDSMPTATESRSCSSATSKMSPSGSSKAVSCMPSSTTSRQSYLHPNTAQQQNLQIHQLSTVQEENSIHETQQHNCKEKNSTVTSIALNSSSSITHNSISSANQDDRDGFLSMPITYDVPINVSHIRRKRIHSAAARSNLKSRPNLSEKFSFDTSEFSPHIMSQNFLSNLANRENTVSDIRQIPKTPIRVSNRTRNVASAIPRQHSHFQTFQTSNHMMDSVNFNDNNNKNSNALLMADKDKQPSVQESTSNLLDDVDPRPSTNEWNLNHKKVSLIATDNATNMTTNTTTNTTPNSMTQDISTQQRPNTRSLNRTKRQPSHMSDRSGICTRESILDQINAEMAEWERTIFDQRGVEGNERIQAEQEAEADFQEIRGSSPIDDQNVHEECDAVHAFEIEDNEVSDSDMDQLAQKHMYHSLASRIGSQLDDEFLDLFASTDDDDEEDDEEEGDD